MILDTISIRHFGPFLSQFDMDLDHRVTIITGSNDVGKSSLLKALSLAFAKIPVTQEEVNHDYLQSAAGDWVKDDTISITTRVKLTQQSDIGDGPFTVGDHANIVRRLASSLTQLETKVTLKKIQGHNPSLVLPVVVRPQLSGALRDEFDLNQLLPLEKALLSAAFQTDFAFAKLKGLNDLHFTRSLKQAEGTLNKLLSKVLPSPGMIHFDLQQIGGERHRLALLLRDRHDGITPFGLRGEGVRRMVTLIADLLTCAPKANHRLVLLDEPENSLHADAQHLLREFLWELTSAGNIQVVYTTHSPSMINPLRPEQVRVLVRDRHLETATTKLLPKPTSRNYAAVRTVLGISAADSLLYAPVTIVTEGETEVRNIYPLLQKLASSKIPGFEDVEKLLGLCMLLDGQGDSFKICCKTAQAHGTQVLLFLDGDKRATVEQQGVADLAPHIPIIFTPQKTEFEELVPKHIYLESVMELAGESFEGTHFNDFGDWCSKEPKRSRMAFSKQVEGWFRDKFDKPFQPKPVIMRRAIELSNAHEIVAAPLLELLNAIRTALAGTSFD